MDGVVVRERRSGVVVRERRIGVGSGGFHVATRSAKAYPRLYTAMDSP